MTVQIFSQDEESPAVDVASVTLPGVRGQLEILPGHAELFALLSPGIFVSRPTTGPSFSRHIPGGVCHVQGDVIRVLL